MAAIAGTKIQEEEMIPGAGPDVAAASQEEAAEIGAMMKTGRRTCRNTPERSR